MILFPAFATAVQVYTDRAPRSIPPRSPLDQKKPTLHAAPAVDPPTRLVAAIP